MLRIKEAKMSEQKDSKCYKHRDFEQSVKYCPSCDRIEFDGRIWMPVIAPSRVDAASLAAHLHEVIDDWRNSSQLHENEERALMYVKTEITKWLERAAKTSTR
jgi:hypothetical protein